MAAVAAVGLAGYLALPDGGEPFQRRTTNEVGTPTSSPLPATLELSPEPTLGNQEEPGEGSSPDPANPTPTPASTQSLCPFLPAGTDPGSSEDLADEKADAAIEKIPVLTVFAASMHASGFDAALRKASGVTIFAPTDDAFAADVPEDELEVMLVDRHADLRKLLERHVVGKQRLLDSLVEAGRATALSGPPVTFAAEGEAVRINGDASVICSDIGADNARIHIIDSVLGYIQLTEPQEEKG